MPPPQTKEQKWRFGFCGPLWNGGGGGGGGDGDGWIRASLYNVHYTITGTCFLYSRLSVLYFYTYSVTLIIINPFQGYSADEQLEPYTETFGMF